MGDCGESERDVAGWKGEMREVWRGQELGFWMKQKGWLERGVLEEELEMEMSFMVLDVVRVDYSPTYSHMIYNPNLGIGDWAFFFLRKRSRVGLIIRVPTYLPTYIRLASSRLFVPLPSRLVQAKCADIRYHHAPN